MSAVPPAAPPAAPSGKTRVAILISGRGSNMRALAGAARTAGFPAEIAGVLSNRPEAPGLAFAAAEGLPVHALDHRVFPSREAFEEAMDAVLARWHTEVIACAGFLRVLSAGFAGRWQGRILNIHPSLLPAFKGLGTHERALAAGVRITGCTVHLVAPEIDSGPIIAQAAVPVLAGDTAETLGARVLAAEHRLYPHALRLFLEARRTPGESREDGEPAAGRAGGTEVLFSPPLVCSQPSARRCENGPAFRAHVPETES